MRENIKTLETYLNTLKENHNILYECWKIARDE